MDHEVACLTLSASFDGNLMALLFSSHLRYKKYEVVFVQILCFGIHANKFIRPHIEVDIFTWLK